MRRSAHLDAAHIVHDGLEGHTAHRVDEQQTDEHKQHDDARAEYYATPTSSLLWRPRATSSLRWRTRAGQVEPDAREAGLELEAEVAPLEYVVHVEARHVGFGPAHERHVRLILALGAVHEVARVVAQDDAIRVGRVHEARLERVAHHYARVVVPAENARARIELRCIALHESPNLGRDQRELIK